MTFIQNLIRRWREFRERQIERREGVSVLSVLDRLKAVVKS